MDRGPNIIEHEPSPKRRRVRKGTQSCWECKRRKIRCTTLAANGASLTSGVVCDGCRSRGTRCIGQDYDDDEIELAKKKSQVQRQLLPAETSDPSVPTPIPNSLKDISHILTTAWACPQELDSLLDATEGVSVLFHGVVCRPYQQLFAELDNINLSPKQILQLPSCETLNHPVLIARRLLLLANCLQASSNDEVNQARHVLPVKVVGSAQSPQDIQARRISIMQKATTVVSQFVTSNDELAGGSLDGIECMMLESMHLNNAGLFRRAWMVNRRAMLMAQLLGLHLVKQNNPDSESRTKKEQFPTLETATRQRINPAIMWYRLNANDVYLSLLLGLPPETAIISSILDTNERPLYATPEVLRRCSPLERLERTITLVGGHILQRQSRRQRSLSTPEAISELRASDDILLEAASHMSPQWWALVPGDNPASHPTCKEKASGSAARKEVEHTLRIMVHFAYHHVLIQLHLPYMLLDARQEDHIDTQDVSSKPATAPNLRTVTNSSRMTAANASRTIVNQYIAFFRNQGNNTKPAYCRGVDFVAFVACVTLCLAHMETRRHMQRNDSGYQVHTQTNYNFLRHQQCIDHGLLERVVGIFERMATMSKADDVAAEKMARLLKQLLAVHDQAEEKRKQGWSVCFRLEAEEHVEAAKSGAAADAATTTAVRIRIPHMDTIVIESLPPDSAHVASRRASAEPAWGGTGMLPCSWTEGDSSVVLNDDWALQGVDVALFSSLAQGMFGEMDAGSDSAAAATRHVPEEVELICPSVDYQTL